MLGEWVGVWISGLGVILEGLRVEAVRQHPALVVVRAQPELALLVRVHGAVAHSEAPVGRHVLVALESFFVPLPSQLVLALVDTLGGHLGLPASLVLYVVALAAKGNGAGAFLLELEQAGLAVAPLVPSQPFILLFKLGQILRFDCVLELVVRKGEVHAVRVHLDEFEVSPVEVVVEEVVVELEHPKLGELVNHNARLERAFYGELLLAQLDLVRVSNLFEVIESGRAKMLVDLVLIPGVQSSGLTLNRFDELAVSTVAQEFEDLGK